MGAFRYKALNGDGKLIKGVMEGDSDRQIRGVLRQRQLRPVEVEAANEALQAGRRLPLRIFSRRLAASDLALITRQLATLVASA